MFNILYKRKLLSTIIPVFNSAEYLEQCLESVCSQAPDDHEIIVVNDNSTDGSPNILNKYKRLQPSIKIIKNKATLGPGFSRNLALNMASGKYLAFVDSDDYLGGQYFESLINCAENKSSDIVFSDYRFIGENISRCRILPMHADREDAKSHLLAHGAYAPWAKLYSTQFIKKGRLQFNNSAFVGEDIQFTWLSYILSEKIDAEPNAVYFYRLNPTGCDNIIDRRILGIFESLKALRDAYRTLTKNGNFDDFLLHLMLSNVHYNFEKMERPEIPASLKQEYVTRSRILLRDFSRREIIENSYLSEQQIAFYEKHINNQRNGGLDSKGACGEGSGPH